MRLLSLSLSLSLPGVLLATALALAVVSPARAQQADSAARAAAPAPANTLPDDSVFLVAQRLVAEGQGAAGRAMVDSLIAAAPPGSSRYAEALFWRASLAATAMEAERDYGKLIVEFPLSPRVEEALLRLSQLEIARGERGQAIRHLDRLLLEHPASPSRARTAYWLAYAQFEERNAPRACAALATARASAGPGDVELRNQIDYYARRCEGVDTTATIAARPATARPEAAPPLRRSESAGTAPPPARQPPASGGRYTVQVAAFDTRAAATQLRDRLAARGYAARIVGAAKPYRVRVGRYATRDAAQAVVRDLAAKQVVRGAIVTEAEAR